MAPDVITLPKTFCNRCSAWQVLDVWRTADAVCFDVDSTVCVDEGIDELAEFCGAGKAVAEWTARAMSGSVPFEQALAARLSLFNPSLSQVKEFLEKRPPRASCESCDYVASVVTPVPIPCFWCASFLKIIP
ncbi:UNVERIFIED_CONTAM: Phosphoserine phosphatase, chloroplastic [Sesamum angustifolium]|uniref:Phosphoserine phosphatase, chloroplastic n=1 Tax=Sesamum angustifolium TaxID=2727405 RepID=A0AAW2QAI1_9LAMI